MIGVRISRATVAVLAVTTAVGVVALRDHVSDQQRVAARASAVGGPTQRVQYLGLGESIPAEISIAGMGDGILYAPWGWGTNTTSHYAAGGGWATCSARTDVAANCSAGTTLGDGAGLQMCSTMGNGSFGCTAWALSGGQNNVYCSAANQNGPGIDFCSVQGKTQTGKCSTYDGGGSTGVANCSAMLGTGAGGGDCSVAQGAAAGSECSSYGGGTCSSSANVHYCSVVAGSNSSCTTMSGGACSASAGTNGSNCSSFAANNNGYSFGGLISGPDSNGKCH